METTGGDFRRELLAPKDAFDCMTDNERQDALENFRAYLSILRKWDQNERLKTENRLGSDGQISVVDSGLG